MTIKIIKIIVYPEETKNLTKNEKWNEDKRVQRKQI